MPVTAFETGLYSELTGAAGLISELGGTYIYNGVAPQNPPAKYVIFQWQGGPGDLNDTPQRSREVLYAIYGVAVGKADAAAIDGQIDTALHLKTLTVSGWTNHWLARERDVNFIEHDSSGKARWRVGAFYRAVSDNA